MNSIIDMFGRQEKPSLILYTPALVPVGSLGAAFNVTSTIRLNDLSTLTFEYPQSVDNGVTKTDGYDNIKVKMIVELSGVGRYIISECPERSTGAVPTKAVTAQSLESEMLYKRITGLSKTLKFYDESLPPLDTVIGRVLKLMPSWTYIDEDKELSDIWRTFDVGDNTIYNFLMSDVETAFNCIFIFDTFNKTITGKLIKNLENDSGAFLSLNNTNMDIEFREYSDELVTALTCYGGTDLDIRGVNPLGGNTIYNFDYYIQDTSNKWMSDGLKEKLMAWKDVLIGKSEDYMDLTLQNSKKIEEFVNIEQKVEEYEVELDRLFLLLEGFEAIPIGGEDAEARATRLAEIARTQTGISNTQIAIRIARKSKAAKQREIDEIFSELRTITNLLNFDGSKSWQTLLDDLIEVKSEIESISKNWRTVFYETANDLQINIVDYPGKIITIEDGLLRADNALEDLLLDVSEKILQYWILTPNNKTSIANKINSSVSLLRVLSREFGNLIANTDIEISIESNAKKLESYGNFITLDSLLSEEENKELENFIFYNTYTNNNIITTDIMTDLEVQEQALKLYNQSVEVLKRASSPRYEFSGNFVSIINIPELRETVEKLNLGKQVTIEISDENITKDVTLLEVSYNYDLPDSLSMVFSNKTRLNMSNFKFADMFLNMGDGGNSGLSGITNGSESKAGAIQESSSLAGTNLLSVTNALISKLGYVSFGPTPPKKYGNYVGSWFGYDKGAKLSLYSSATDYLQWNGTKLLIKAKNFTLDSNGNITANNADLAGKITAAEGDIGGWLIGPNTLYSESGSVTLDSGIVAGNPNIRMGGASGSMYGEGIYMGKSEDLYVFRVGDPNGDYFAWDGETVNFAGGWMAGWRVSPTWLIGGEGDNSVTLSSASMMTTPYSRIVPAISAGGDVVAEGSEIENVPFRVYHNGDLYASSASITGNITAQSGEIGGWSVTSTCLIDEAGLVGMSSGSIGDDPIRFWAGNTNPIAAPFYVTEDGILHATNAFITGSVVANVVDATSGSIGGWIIAENNIHSGDSTPSNYVEINSGSTINYTIIAGGSMDSSAPFVVYKDGSIKASKGTIANWSITPGSLVSPSESAGITDGLYAFYAGNTNPINANFFVKTDGFLKASKGDIAGWSINTGALVSSSGNVGMRTEGSTGSEIRFWAGNAINEASIPFKVLEDGSVFATKGEIGGWTIGVDSLTGGDADKAVGLSIGIGGGNYAMWAGDPAPENAEFSVTSAGFLNASAGLIAGWSIGSGSLYKEGIILDSNNDTIYVGQSGSPRIVIDGTGTQIRSSNYASGASGFAITGRSGNAEFNNILARGEIRSSVFSYDEITATAGTFGVFKSAGTIKFPVTTPVSGSFLLSVEDPGAGLPPAPYFAIGDILRIKTIAVDSGSHITGVTDIWATVTSYDRYEDLLDQKNSCYQYVCEWKSGGSTILMPGQSVIDYGSGMTSSGSPDGGGHLIMQAQDDTFGNGPFYAVNTAGSMPWVDTLKQHLRLGNLKGCLGFTDDTYGIAIGADEVSGNYLSYDSQSGLLKLRGAISITGAPEDSSIPWEYISGSPIYYYTSEAPITTNVVEISGITGGSEVILEHNGIYQNDGYAYNGEFAYIKGKANLYWDSTENKWVIGNGINRATETIEISYSSVDGIYYKTGENEGFPEYVYDGNAIRYDTSGSLWEITTGSSLYTRLYESGSTFVINPAEALEWYEAGGVISASLILESDLYKTIVPDTVFYESSASSAYAIPDLFENWYVTSTGCPIEIIAKSYSQILKDSDVWIDINDSNHMWLFKNSAWVDIQDGNISNIANDVYAAQEYIISIGSLVSLAQATADSKINTFYSATTPSADLVGAGDLWMDSSSGNKLYFASSDNVSVKIKGRGRLNLSDFPNETINSGVEIIELVSSSASIVEGIYYKKSEENGFSEYTCWTDVEDPSAFNSIRYDTSESIWEITTSGSLYTRSYESENTTEVNPANVVNWYESGGVTSISIVLTPSVSYNYIEQGIFEQGISLEKPFYTNGEYTIKWDKNEVVGEITGVWKIVDNTTGSTIYYSLVDEPTPDLCITWKDTNDINLDYGSILLQNVEGWIEIQDQSIQQAILDAGTAQATADGKITTFYQEEAPTPEESSVGDLWIDTTDNNNKLYRYSGYSWEDVQDKEALNQLADMANDNMLTPVEKIVAKDKFSNEITPSYTSLISSASNILSSGSPYNASYIIDSASALELEYGNLEDYLSASSIGVIISGSESYTTSNIDKNAWNQKWNLYYTSFENLKSSLQESNAVTVFDNIYNLPSMYQPPSGTGLYITGSYMGYYSSGSWLTYIENNGSFAFGDTNQSYTPSFYFNPEDDITRAPALSIKQANLDFYSGGSAVIKINPGNVNNKVFPSISIGDIAFSGINPSDLNGIFTGTGGIWMGSRAETSSNDYSLFIGTPRGGGGRKQYIEYNAERLEIQGADFYVGDEFKIGYDSLNFPFVAMGSPRPTGATGSDFVRGIYMGVNPETSSKFLLDEAGNKILTEDGAYILADAPSYVFKVGGDNIFLYWSGSALSIAGADINATTLTASGTGTFTGLITANGGLTVPAAGTLSVAGSSTFTGLITGTITSAQNADTVGGEPPSAFANASHTHAYLPIASNIELGNHRTSSGVAYIDFHYTYPVVDYDTRILSDSGQVMKYYANGGHVFTGLITAGAGLTIPSTENLTVTGATITGLSHSSLTDLPTGDPHTQYVKNATSTITDNAIVRFNGTTGHLIQGYTSNTPTISDTGNVIINRRLIVNGQSGVYSVAEIKGEDATSNNYSLICRNSDSISTFWVNNAGDASVRKDLTVLGSLGVTGTITGTLNGNASTATTATTATNATKLNNQSASYYAKAAQPRVKVSRGAMTSTTTLTSVNWTTQWWDTDDMYSATYPNRITFTTAGVYAVSAFITWASGTTNSYRIIAAFLNDDVGQMIMGSTVGALSTAVTTTTISTVYYFSAGDYITIKVQSGESETINSVYAHAVKVSD